MCPQADCTDQLSCAWIRTPVCAGQDADTAHVYVWTLREAEAARQAAVSERPGIGHPSEAQAAAAAAAAGPSAQADAALRASARQVRTMLDCLYALVCAGSAPLQTQMSGLAVVAMARLVTLVVWHSMKMRRGPGHLTPYCFLTTTLTLAAAMTTTLSLSPIPGLNIDPERTWVASWR